MQTRTIILAYMCSRVMLVIVAVAVLSLPLGLQAAHAASAPILLGETLVHGGGIWADPQRPSTTIGARFYMGYDAHRDDLSINEEGLLKTIGASQTFARGETGVFDFDARNSPAFAYVVTKLTDGVEDTFVAGTFSFNSNQHVTGGGYVSCGSYGWMEFPGSNIEFFRLIVNDVSWGPTDDGRYAILLNGQWQVYGRLPKPPQKVYLAWGQDVPVLIERKTNLRGESVYIERSGSMAHTTVSATDQTDIQQRVAQMFADSGVRNIEFVNSATDATTVYFAQTPTGDPNWSLLGKAYSGIDRYNKSKTGAVAVFVTGVNEIDAEVAVHEMGHTLGLRHVNPGADSDPSNLEIMDYEDELGDKERFINTVSHITEPPTAQGTVQSKTHNPVYHLRRYVDGWSHDALVATGIDAGTWDRSLFDRIVSSFSFDGTDRMLYDMYLLSGATGDCMDVIAHYDSILLSQLSQLEFELDADTPFEMVASSAAGGNWDLSLSVGDPFIASNTAFMPTDGTVMAFLQQITGQNAYTTLGDVAVQMTTIPEPASLSLLVLGGLAVIRRRRK